MSQKNTNGSGFAYILGKLYLHCRSFFIVFFDYLLLFWIFYFGKLMFGIWRKLAKVRGGDNGEVNIPLSTRSLFVHVTCSCVCRRRSVALRGWFFGR